MPSKIISDSPNIAVLDSSIQVDGCNGNINVDITPSVFIGSGASNVLGVSVKVLNVSRGTVTKAYPTSGYDIASPFTDVISVTIPTIAGSYQFGNYSVSVLLTDAGGNTYELQKNVNLCQPYNNNGGKFGNLSATLTGSCKNGSMTVVADTPPNYESVAAESEDNNFTLEYPTSSLLAPLASTVSNFNVKLYEGVYDFSGTSCVTYNVGDNITYKVSYSYSAEKNIKCSIDSACISARIAALVDELNTDCTFKEKQQTESVILQALILLKAIDTFADLGLDYSDYVSQLEDVLGCVCTCNCVPGTPINPDNAGTNVIINGCGIDSVTVGLTTTYTINNYDFVTDVASNGGALTIGASVLNGCSQKQTLVLNVPILYAQMKAQVNNQVEWDFWASVIKKSINGIDPTCLGLTPTQLIALSFKDLMQLIVNSLCAGGVCNGVILNDSTTGSGSDVNINWNINIGTGVYETAIYMDGILQGTVLAPAATYKIIGAGDGNLHTYDLVSKCSNGSIGVSLEGSFTYSGCPTIAPPIVNSNNVVNAACPYDLTSLQSVSPPSGIVYEWHNFNSTSLATKVLNPNSVTSGTYFIFAKDANNCFSAGVQVVLSCSVATNCSAPQNMAIDSITGGVRIRFQSASYAPPLNSYTVKRRLATDPDVDGSYTTIGTPTWNASVSRWEIVDNTPTANVSYVYRAVSNCTSGAPYIDLTFANMTCVNLELTSAGSSLVVSLTRTSTQLTALITGGTPPYNYTFMIVPGAGYTCEAHTMSAATGTTSGTSATTNYTATAYAGTSYDMSCQVVDSASTVASSNTIVKPPCLSPDTDIEMKDGSIMKIVDLKAGDELGEGNKVEFKEDRVVKELYVINGGLLKSSKGHIHIVVEDGEEKQIEAAHLKEGMFYQGKDGLVEIKKIEVKEGEFKVVDISTTTGKYWANGILTHNKLACP